MAKQKQLPVLSVLAEPIFCVSLGVFVAVAGICLILLVVHNADKIDQFATELLYKALT